jgi:glutamyl-Q tRNA(Asp) synthetase
LLRLEDIDGTRVRPEYEAAIFEDLAWLGMSWETPVRKQAEHLQDYQTALNQLETLGLIYPCFCTRKEIQAEIGNAGQAPQGPDGPLYPGICRRLSADEVEERTASGLPYALRLNVKKAAALAGPLTFLERSEGLTVAKPDLFGDVVLARKETPTSYHLSVVVDDALQGITLVTRGEDLKPATHLHRLLQGLLGLPVPEWHHHALITDETGKRLAKRDNARSIRSLRESGMTPERVWETVVLRLPQ